MQKYHGPIFGAKTIPTTYYISYIAVGKKIHTCNFLLYTSCAKFKFLYEKFGVEKVSCLRTTRSFGRILTKKNRKPRKCLKNIF